MQVLYHALQGLFNIPRSNENFTESLDYMLELHSLYDLQEAVLASSGSAIHPELKAMQELIGLVLENGCSWVSHLSKIN